MKKFFYLVAMATVMMTSCSKSDEMTIESGVEDLKIKFGSSAMSVDVKTRGPINAQAAITDLQLVRVTDHLTSAADWSTAAVATTATAAWNSTNTNYDLTPATAQYYNVDPLLYSTFTAYAPAATFASAATPTATWTIDGKTDILVSSAVAEGTKANGSTSPVTALNFPLEHKLLQLRFTLLADGAAAQTAWGAVTGIEILDSPNSAIATLPAATMSFPDAAPADLTNISVYAYGLDDVLSASNKVTLPLAADVAATPLANEHVYAMVAPNTVNGSDQFKIKVYTENNADGTELTVTLDDTPDADGGDSYAITLTFKATVITFEATLANWVEAGKTGWGTVE